MAREIYSEVMFVRSRPFLDPEVLQSRFQGTSILFRRILGN